MLRVNAFGRWSLHLHIVMSLKDLAELVNPSHPVFDIGQLRKLYKAHLKIIINEVMAINMLSLTLMVFQEVNFILHLLFFIIRDSIYTVINII